MNGVISADSQDAAQTILMGIVFVAGWAFVLWILYLAVPAFFGGIFANPIAAGAYPRMRRRGWSGWHRHHWQPLGIRARWGCSRNVWMVAAAFDS